MAKMLAPSRSLRISGTFSNLEYLKLAVNVLLESESDVEKTLGNF